MLPRKQNSEWTWNEIYFPYAEVVKVWFAKICGLNVIVQVNDLGEVSSYY